MEIRSGQVTVLDIGTNGLIMFILRRMAPPSLRDLLHSRAGD